MELETELPEGTVEKSGEAPVGSSLEYAVVKIRGLVDYLQGELTECSPWARSGVRGAVSMLLGAVSWLEKADRLEAAFYREVTDE